MYMVFLTYKVFYIKKLDPVGQHNKKLSKANIFDKAYSLSKS